MTEAAVFTLQTNFAGTPEGAKRGWATRRGAMPADDVRDPSVSDDPYKWELKTRRHATLGTPAKTWTREHYTVEFYPETHDPDTVGELLAVTPEGQVIGDLSFGFLRGTMEAAAEVHPEYRRLGIATDLYDRGEELTGKQFTPAPSRTRAATAFWKNRLKQQGRDAEATFAVDPEFETQHPRDPAGRWAKKPALDEGEIVEAADRLRKERSVARAMISALDRALPVYPDIESAAAHHPEALFHGTLAETADLVLQGGSLRPNEGRLDGPMGVLLSTAEDAVTRQFGRLTLVIDPAKLPAASSGFWRWMREGNVWEVETVPSEAVIGLAVRNSDWPLARYAVDPAFESLHPRDPEGQWTDKGGGTAVLDDEFPEPPMPAGFEIDEHNKYVGTLPTDDLWSTVVDLNERTRSVVYTFGRYTDLIVDPETGRAAFSVYKDHGPMIQEMEPDDYVNRQDAYARVVLCPDQESGPGWMTIVPPWLHTAQTETERAQHEYRAVRKVLQWLHQSGVPERLKVEVSWGSSLNWNRAEAATGKGTSLFAADPEFETLHPRDPEGQWTEKPDVAPQTLPGWEGLRFRTVTGDRPWLEDRPPARTPEGDYVFYHGTPAFAVASIQEHGLRPDNLRMVGLGTRPGAVSLFGRLHLTEPGLGRVLRVVIDKDWLETQAMFIREGGHKDLFLLTWAHDENQSGDWKVKKQAWQGVPRSALKRIDDVSDDYYEGRIFAADPDFNAKHPRGKPGNRGQFKEKPEQAKVQFKELERLKQSYDPATRMITIGSRKYPAGKYWNDPDADFGFLDPDGQKIEPQLAYEHKTAAQELGMQNEWEAVARGYTRVMASPAGREITLEVPATNPKAVASALAYIRAQWVDGYTIMVDYVTRDPENLTLAGSGASFYADSPEEAAREFAKLQTKAHATDTDFEQQHPRGKPGNRGQFKEKPESAKAKSKNAWRKDSLRGRDGQALFVHNTRSSEGLWAQIEDWVTPSIVLNPETGETAAVDDRGGHENLLDNIGYKDASAVKRDEFAHVEIVMEVIDIVPPVTPKMHALRMAAGSAIMPESPQARQFARLELDAVKKTIAHLERSGIPILRLRNGQIGIKVHWWWNSSSEFSDPTSGLLTRMLAVDPEFETLHPRDPEGQWVDKPGEPSAAIGAGRVRSTPVPVFWHGSPSGLLRSGTSGLHVGTRLAAKQALEARIGIRADGKDWDGTQEYGKTLLAGKKTLLRLDPRGYNQTGYNSDGSNYVVPDEDYYPTARKERAAYSDGSFVAFDAKPDLFPVRIVGPMTNRPTQPRSDDRANARMIRAIKQGRMPAAGSYYINKGEDAGSISAVVPDESFVQRVPRTHAVDPEFESLHPRDPEGQWTEKPGGNAAQRSGPWPAEGALANFKLPDFADRSGVGGPEESSAAWLSPSGRVFPIGTQTHDRWAQLNLNLNVFQALGAGGVRIDFAKGGEMLPSGRYHTAYFMNIEASREALRDPVTMEALLNVLQANRPVTDYAEIVVDQVLPTDYASFEDVASFTAALQRLQAGGEIRSRSQVSRWRSAEDEATFTLQTTFATDTDFEMKHPRGQPENRGWFKEKPVEVSTKPIPSWVNPALGVPGSSDAFVKQTMRNVDRLAAAPLAPETRARVIAALEFAYANRETPLTTAEHVSAFITEIATRVAGQPPVSKTEIVAPLARRLTLQLNDPLQNPMLTAAWVERNVDSALQPLGAASEHTARVLAAFVTRRGGFHQPHLPGRDEFYQHLRTDRWTDWMDFYTRAGMYAQRFAQDPEFEGKHPRDPKGQFEDKPDAPAAPEQRSSAADQGLAAMKRDMMEKFGFTDEQAEANLAFIRQVNARLAGPTKVEPTPAQRLGMFPGKTFRGRCYEMAAKYILDHAYDADVADYTLVHGVVDQSPGESLQIGHGWVETADGKVFDGTTQEWYEKASYYATFNAKAEVRYTAAEARHLAFSTGNWGCWHETAGFVNKLKPPKRSPLTRRRKAGHA